MRMRPSSIHCWYGCSAASSRLDLVVVDDAALRGVDEEHAARLQAHLAHDLLGGGCRAHPTSDAMTTRPSSVTHSARRAQTVAVEHGADDGAVGEAHRRRSVPRLHERGVVLVERPTRRIHALVPLPRLRDHHEHGVRQAAAAEVQQLEHLVEARGVRGARGADREDLLELVATTEDVAVDQRLACTHPVLVAGDGVDLTVVCDATERDARAATTGRCWWRSASAPDRERDSTRSSCRSR